MHSSDGVSYLQVTEHMPQLSRDSSGTSDDAIASLSMSPSIQEAPLPSQVEPHAKCGATILTEVPHQGSPEDGYGGEQSKFYHMRFEEADFNGYGRWVKDEPAEEMEDAFRDLATFKKYWLHRKVPAIPGLGPAVDDQEYRHLLLYFLFGNFEFD